MISRNGSVSMGAPLETLRRAVARSAGYGRLNDLYCGFYDKAVASLAEGLHPLGGIVSLLSRNSYADGSYTPGISDIDLVVIVDDTLETGELRQLLADIGVQGKRFRRRFPMLGELPVYTRYGFDMACQLGAPLSETYAWRCEWGDARVLDTIVASPAMSKEEVLARAIQVYINGFHNNVHAALARRRARPSLAVQRAARKVERELSKLGALPGIAWQGTMAEIIHSVFRANHKAVMSAPLDTAAHTWPLVEEGERATELILDEAAALPGGLISVVQGIKGREPCYIVDDGLDARGIGVILARIKSDDAIERRFRLLSRALFTYYLRNLNPVMYYRLASARSVAGEDIVPGIEPPTEFGIRRFFAFEAMHLLRMFPEQLQRAQSEPGFLPAQRRRLSRLGRFECNGDVLLTGKTGQPELDMKEREQECTVTLMRETLDVLQRADTLRANRSGALAV